MHCRISNKRGKRIGRERRGASANPTRAIPIRQVAFNSGLRENTPHHFFAKGENLQQLASNEQWMQYEPERNTVIHGVGHPRASAVILESMLVLPPAIRSAA